MFIEPVTTSDSVRYENTATCEGEDLPMEAKESVIHVLRLPAP